MEPFVTMHSRGKRNGRSSADTTGVMHNHQGTCPGVTRDAERVTMSQALAIWPDKTYTACRMCYRTKIGRPREARLSAVHLIAYLEDFAGEKMWASNGTSRKNAALAEICHVSLQTIGRWRAKGEVPLGRGEEICDLIKVHPYEIWGDEYYRMADLASSTRLPNAAGRRPRLPELVGA